MDCREVQELLKVVVDRRGGSRRAEALRSHLSACPVCRAFERDVTHIRQVLQNDPVPTMPAALPDRVLSTVRGQRQGWRPVALAASLLIVAGTVAGVLTYRTGGEDAVPVAVEQSEWRSRTVTLALDSPRTLDDVEFRLELPPEVEIQGYPGYRELAWTDRLDAGPNELRIPLIVRGEGGGELVATLIHDGRSRNLRVPLDEQ